MGQPRVRDPAADHRLLGRHIRTLLARPGTKTDCGVLGRPVRRWHAAGPLPVTSPSSRELDGLHGTTGRDTDPPHLALTGGPHDEYLGSPPTGTAVPAGPPTTCTTRGGVRPGRDHGWTTTSALPARCADGATLPTGSGLYTTSTTNYEATLESSSASDKGAATASQAATTGHRGGPTATQSPASRMRTGGPGAVDGRRLCTRLPPTPATTATQSQGTDAGEGGW